MKVDRTFRFQASVSLDTYQSKKEATACLSSNGAAAIGKNKMAFKREHVSTDEFLKLAISGHTFCNLFKYNPTKQYWFQAKDGRWFQAYPDYKRGVNRGGMKLCMKSDQFFEGAQTVFVDIDFTKYTNVKDYLSTLTYRPTCVYMSYSDNRVKHGRTSRRFRMVYVFDKVLNREEFCFITQKITDQIIHDTQEPMDDDCGTRMSQYMNGVYGNNEVYAGYNVYSMADFLEKEDGVNTACAISNSPLQNSITFDEKMLNDMQNSSVKNFLHYYSWKYPYQYRIEKPEWLDNLYQLTDENYLQLWWYREKQVDGQHRRRKLFKNACMRRLMFPSMTPDAALYNLYLDFVRFFDNSDYVITLDCLVRKVKHAFEKTPQQLAAYCNREIQYWSEHRPEFIIKPGICCNRGLIAQIKKCIHWNIISKQYDTKLSIQENIQNGIGVPQATLYRYCKANNIDTNPNKRETEAEKRAAKRKEKQDKKNQFLSLYDPSKTVIDNQHHLAANGLSLSTGTISNWAHRYYAASSTDAPFFEFPSITFEKPVFEDFIIEAPVDYCKNHEKVEAYSWWKPEDNGFRWY